MFIRLHTPPRICRIDRSLYGAREKYYFKKSFDRYSKTDDGITMNEIANNIFSQYDDPIFGRIDSIKIYYSPGHKESTS